MLPLLASRVRTSSRLRRSSEAFPVAGGTPLAAFETCCRMHVNDIVMLAETGSKC